jgi:hypothetical protein
MKRTLLLILLVTNVLLCYSQELPDHAPVAPNSSALGSYGANPVSYYTGTPQISVPVYTIKTNTLNFPIALNYHADGLKVLSEATFVGLDWTLSNSGVITRSIEALDDLTDKGYYHHPFSQIAVGNGKDPAPDAFYYNFNGKSGCFVIEYPGVVRLLKKDNDISIQLDPDQNFKIIVEDGTVYYFAKKEYQDQAITISGSSPDRHIDRHYVTAWYLSSITSTTGEVMAFNYTSNMARTISDHQSVSSSTFNSIQILGGGTCTTQDFYNIQHQYEGQFTTVNSTFTHSITDEVLLDNITFTGGVVRFTYSDRYDIQSDLPNGQYAQKLDQIAVYDNNNLLVKKYGLGYTYFTAPINGQNGYLNQRLQLRSFYELPGAYVEPKLTYTFSYNTTSSAPFPTKSDATHEPFGFYSADPTLGLLQQIKYPTGGSVNFTFESIGLYGARIGKIENWGANNEVLGCKKFTYAGGRPMIGILNTFTTVYFTTYTCNNPDSFSTIANIYVNYTSTKLNSFLQTGPSNMGNIYGYDQVTELDGPNGENGKTVYNYYNVADTPNDIFVSSTHDQNNGLLLSKETYKNTGTNTFGPMAKTVYTPLTRNQVVITGKNWSSAGNDTFSSYNINSQDVVITKEENWTYAPSGTMYGVIDYTYHPNYLQPATIQTTSSDNKVLKTINRYAYDMGAISPYTDMVAAHMISQPIETEKQVNGVLDKTINTYSKNWPAFPGLILPNDVGTQKNSNPVETRIQYNGYDGYVNPSSLSYKAGPNVVYTWGYNGLYPVSKTINAPLGNIAFSNCEEPLTLAQTDKSGSNLYFYTNDVAFVPYNNAHTGHKSFYLTTGSQHTISTRNTLPSGKYVFSYWSKCDIPNNTATVSLGTGITILSQQDQAANNMGWRYHEAVVTLPVADYFTIYPNAGGANIFIDDIRIYPVGAQMTTYTYDPLIGVTSITDGRNNVLYYEYDNFKRLSKIKDQNGNIKNSYCYNYAGQSFGCLVTFNPPPPAPTPDPPVGLYVRLEITNVNNEYFGSGDTYSSIQSGEICIKLYSDPACTIPLTLPYDIPIVLTLGYNILDDMGNDAAVPDYGIYMLTAGNSSYCLGAMDLYYISHYLDGNNNPHYQEYDYHYFLTPGSNAYREKPTVTY